MSDVQKMYSIFDAKAGLYLPPFLSVSDGDACRQVLRELYNPDSNFNRFAEDYSLFEVGSFDHKSGRPDYLEAPVSVTGIWLLKAALKTNGGA